MKKLGLVLLLIMALSLVSFTVFAEDDENLEDMPTTVDETANASDPEPTLPEVKKESSNYFGVVDMWAAYTTLSMAAVNTRLETNLLYTNPSSTKITGGYTLGLDVNFLFIKDLPLALGLRFELVNGFQGKFSGDISLLTLTYSYTISPTLIPFMAGGEYSFEIPGTPISISGDIYAGYAIARAAVVSSTTILLTTTETNVTYSGSGFVMDFGTKINYQISEPITAGLKLSYRFANIAKMTANNSAGSVFTDSNNNTAPFDFSGLNIGLNVDMKY